jgi:hypothetical protein
VLSRPGKPRASAGHVTRVPEPASCARSPPITVPLARPSGALGHGTVAVPEPRYPRSVLLYPFWYETYLCKSRVASRSPTPRRLPIASAHPPPKCEGARHVRPRMEVALSAKRPISVPDRACGSRLTTARMPNVAHPKLAAALYRAFPQSPRRGHCDLSTDLPTQDRVRVVFDNLARPLRSHDRAIGGVKPNRSPHQCRDGSGSRSGQRSTDTSVMRSAPRASTTCL